MLPNTKAEAHNILQGVWHGRPEADFGCLIINYISENLDAKYLPFSDLFKIARSHHIEQQDVVLNVVNYLTGAHLPLLDAGFEYIEDEIVEGLNPDQVKAAYTENINPLSGYIDQDVAKKIFMYLLPSKAAKSALRSAE